MEGWWGGVVERWVHMRTCAHAHAHMRTCTCTHAHLSGVAQRRAGAVGLYNRERVDGGEHEGR